MLGRRPRPATIRPVLGSGARRHLGAPGKGGELVARRLGLVGEDEGRLAMGRDADGRAGDRIEGWHDLAAFRGDDRGAALAHRASDGRVERRERMAEWLRRPRFQPEELDHDRVAVVARVDLAHEGLEERAMLALHVPEHRVLFGGREILEALGVSPLALDTDLPHALDEHPAGGRGGARRAVEMLDQVQVAGSRKPGARRHEAVQHGLDHRVLREGKDAGHHRFRAFFAR